jgi:hypothetical protein
MPRLRSPKSRRASVVALVTLAALLGSGYLLRDATVPPATAAPLRLLCGVERWPVKTFSDGDKGKVSLTRRYRTVKQLNKLVRAKKRPQNARVTGEFSVYRVTATVTATINEDDGDVHLVLTGADGSTMIAEAPEPACSVGSRNRTAINKARLAAQDIQPGDKVTAAGVGFFDFAHKQTGHADNYLELHPLLSIRRL